MRRLATGLAIIALLVVSLEASAQEPAATRPLTAAEREALNPPRTMIDLGRSVAETACAECHGMNGVSDEAGKPHLAAQRLVYLHRVLKAYQTRERHSDLMNHATGFLNDEALLSVAAYYASQPPAPGSTEAAPPEMPAGDPFGGIRDDMKKCVKCHGEDGNSTASGMPNLTAQSPAYFVTSMQAYGDGERDHKLMSRLVGGLSEQEIADMGVFYAVQAPLRSETIGEGDAEAGRAAAETCANCHGADGNAGGEDMPTLAGQDARYFIKAMNAYRDGSRRHEKMFEAAENLSEADIENLATFYALQEPVRRNVRTPLTTGEWIARCERCHGIDGNSTDPRFPMLAGQDPTYLAAALQAYSAGGRANSTMHAMAEPLSDADIIGIAEHFAAQVPRGVVYMIIPCEED